MIYLRDHWTPRLLRAHVLSFLHVTNRTSGGQTTSPPRKPAKCCNGSRQPLWHSSLYSSSLEASFPRQINTGNSITVGSRRTLPTRAKKLWSSHRGWGVPSLCILHYGRGHTKGSKLHVALACEHTSIIKLSPPLPITNEALYRNLTTDFCEWFRQAARENSTCGPNSGLQKHSERTSPGARQLRCSGPGPIGTVWSLYSQSRQNLMAVPAAEHLDLSACQHSILCN